MKKRTWIYIQEPATYEISCRCGSKNITWSEFEGCIWCFDCETDNPGDGGVFSGPIPIHGAGILGMSFDRISLIGGYVERMKVGKDRVYWEPDWSQLREMWE